jgi:hypothetical protein
MASRIFLTAGANRHRHTDFVVANEIGDSVRVLSEFAFQSKVPCAVNRCDLFC